VKATALTPALSPEERVEQIALFYGSLAAVAIADIRTFGSGGVKLQKVPVLHQRCARFSLSWGRGSG